jgi:hypothetical protein
MASAKEQYPAVTRLRFGPWKVFKRTKILSAGRAGHPTQSLSSAAAKIDTKVLAQRRSPFDCYFLLRSNVSDQIEVKIRQRRSALCRAGTTF